MKRHRYVWQERKKQKCAMSYTTTKKEWWWWTTFDSSRKLSQDRWRWWFMFFGSHSILRKWNQNELFFLFESMNHRNDIEWQEKKEKDMRNEWEIKGWLSSSSMSCYCLKNCRFIGWLQFYYWTNGITMTVVLYDYLSCSPSDFSLRNFYFMYVHTKQKELWGMRVGKNFRWKSSEKKWCELFKLEARKENLLETFN